MDVSELILFEDEDVIAINKPHNLLIHPSYYARNIKEESLIEMLRRQISDSIVPLHRLDRKTSGVILFARNATIAKEYQDELFTKNTIHKTYIAIVRGFISEEGKVDSPIRKDETTVYKEALTHYKKLAQIELDIPVHPYSTARYSLVQLTPTTGRMHQLRKHMNKISHPIVGDYKHGDRFHNRMFEQEFDCHNLFLHASEIQYTNPKTKKPITISASLSANWKSVFGKFDWKI